MTVKVEQSDLHNPIRVENPYKGLDYNLLHNIPTVDGKEVKGDMTTQQLIGFDKDYVDNLNTQSIEQHNQDENAHPPLLNKINTLRNDLGYLGEQVSNIESKIPENTSTTNTLVNQTQLLNTELNLKEDIANDIEEHNISTIAHQDIRTAIETLQFVKWVDALPETGESKYIYAVPREETDTDGKQIAALYLWDGSAWRGAGAFSLNIDPDTLATKTDLTNYLPLTGGTLSGVLQIVGPKSVIQTYTGGETSGYTRLSLEARDSNWVELRLLNKQSQTSLYTDDIGKTYLTNQKSKAKLVMSDDLRFNDNKVLDTSDKAVANGVASLDANAKVPSAQIPVATASTLGGVKVEFDETTGTLNIKTE